MGCVDQHQICKPGSGEAPKCTPLSSSVISLSEVAKLEFNQVQHDTAYVIQASILGGEMLNSIAGRGAVALRAQLTVFDSINVALPDNQWTIEVGNWFSIALARLQYAILEYSTGPAYTDEERYRRDTTPFLDRIYANTCNHQKSRQSSSSSNSLTFSVSGLVAIFVVGIIVTALSLPLPWIVGLRRSGNWCHRHREWKLHSKFQRVTPESPAGSVVPRVGTSPQSPQAGTNGRLTHMPRQIQGNSSQLDLAPEEGNFELLLVQPNRDIRTETLPPLYMQDQLMLEPVQQPRQSMGEGLRSMPEPQVGSQYPPEPMGNQNYNHYTRPIHDGRFVAGDAAVVPGVRHGSME